MVYEVTARPPRGNPWLASGRAAPLGSSRAKPNVFLETAPVFAEIVRSVVGKATEIVTTPSDDNRSYHISSERIRRELGFEPTHNIEDAVVGLVDGFQAGRIPDSMNNIRYFNIKTMQAVHLK